MSIQRGFLSLCAVMCAAFAATGTSFADTAADAGAAASAEQSSVSPASSSEETPALAEVRPARSEEALISSMTGESSVLRLDADSREIRIPFTIAPNAVPEGVELLMSADPDGRRSGGRIEVFVNRSRAVELQPRAEPFEARFALYSDDLRAGENMLVMRIHDAGETGWTIDADASRLRVSARPAGGYAALDEIEKALAADFAAPRRVFIDADPAGEDALAVAALVSQGLALRMGEAPILVRDPSVAELTVRAELRSGAAAPAIDLTGPSELRLSAGSSGSLIAAARLFAARSMDAHTVRFDMTSALTARRLDRPRVPSLADAALEGLASGGAPFGADQGGRAAVVFAGTDPEERAASLAVVARAALASGSAWLYAWYGEDADAAPLNHDLLVLGPQSAIDPRLMALAPAEVRAAASAAANRAPRERRYYGSTAFASDDVERDAMITGVAALFERSDGRRVALITAPEGADYARAAKRLARSGLWTGLSGRAALWDAADVTPFGPSSAPRFSAEWASSMVRANDHWLAIGAFGLAVLLLLLGHGVKRTSSRRA
ncbi:MAG: hypothetical protein ABL308_09115 [Oceanicaulis sp.]